MKFRMDFLHCALITIVVLLAVYFRGGSGGFRELFTPKQQQDCKRVCNDWKKSKTKPKLDVDCRHACTSLATAKAAGLGFP